MNFKECEPGCTAANFSNLPSLMERREQARSTLFEDIVKNDIVVKPPSYTMKKTGNTRPTSLAL